MSGLWRRLRGLFSPQRVEQEPPPKQEPQEPLPLQQEELLQLQRSLDTDSHRASQVDPSVVLKLINDLVSQGSSRRAADVLRRLCRRLPRATALHLRLAELLIDMGRPAEALKLAELLGQDPAHGPEPHVLAGACHEREASLNAALDHYEAALGLELKHARARRHADALRSKLDLPLASATPTLLGPQELGPGSRFLLQRELGRGGGGTVYLAHDRSLGRPVAVKVLHPRLSSRPEARAHLFCEARITASLAHPGIVTIYDLDEILNLVVMEHCAGGALADLITGSPLPLSQALRLLAAVTKVLDVVHRCGVVHRDLKPANLLFRREPGSQPILTDFGIAHAAGLDDDPAQQAAGSLTYVAPETRKGADADPRADLYGCGVILLEMLLGRPPLTHQQAVRGTSILELDQIWLGLQDELPSPVIDLARSLVDPAEERRPGTALAVSEQASALADHWERQQTGRTVMQELLQRAGSPPHDKDTERWLVHQQQRLELDRGSV